MWNLNLGHYSPKKKNLISLVYRKTTEFCIFILYPATLLNFLMNTSSSLMASLGFSMYVIFKPWQIYLFCSNLHSFYFFFFSLISVARTSKTTMNKSSQIGHLCLVPYLRDNSFSFPPLRMMLIVGFSNIPFIVLRYIPSMPIIWEVFSINRYLILSKVCPASIEMIIWFLFFNLLMMHHIDWFVDTEKYLHPWDKSYLIIVYNLLCVCVCVCVQDLFNVLSDSVC